MTEFFVFMGGVIDHTRTRILRGFYPKSPVVSKNMVLWQETRIGYVQFYPVIGQQLAT